MITKIYILSIEVDVIPEDIITSCTTVVSIDRYSLTEALSTLFLMNVLLACCDVIHLILSEYIELVEILVNTISGNGMLPDGTKPLTEPVWSRSILALIPGNINFNTQDGYLHHVYQIWTFEITATFPRGQWGKIWFGYYHDYDYNVAVAHVKLFNKRKLISNTHG